MRQIYADVISETKKENSQTKSNARFCSDDESFAAKTKTITEWTENIDAITKPNTSTIDTTKFFNTENGLVADWNAFSTVGVGALYTISIHTTIFARQQFCKSPKWWKSIRWRQQHSNIKETNLDGICNAKTDDGARRAGEIFSQKMKHYLRYIQPNRSVPNFNKTLAVDCLSAADARIG